MTAEDLEFIDIQTGQLKLLGSGDDGMHIIAFKFEEALNSLLKQGLGTDVKARIQWLNFREKLNNPDGDQGSFRILLIRKRQE